MKNNNTSSFTDIFIKRPVLSIVICLVLLLLGIISYLRLQVRQYPKIDSSVITISTTYPGASPSLMENFITSPLETAISGVEGIDYVTSSSTYSSSTININLNIGYSIDAALSDISAQVNSARWRLPQNINDPIIQKQDPNATPVYYLSFSSTQWPAIKIGNYLTRSVVPAIQTLPGVGAAQVYGENVYAMRIWLNPERMAARNVTASDVANALRLNNVQSTAGQIDESLQQFNVFAETDLHTPQQFNDMVVREQDGQAIRIRDIGNAELGAEKANATVYMDGKTSVTIGVIPKSTANPLDIAKEVKKILPNIRRGLPSQVKNNLSYDISKSISESIHEVYWTLFEAFIIVFLVVFLILGSWRSVIVPLVTIPLSIISACSLLLMLGYSINTLTLLAFVLAIGLVVDDAIVVTENIHRHILLDGEPMKAAKNGAREIRFAVIAMTVTLAAAYLPIGLMTGLTGTLFSEFAFTLAFTVILSGIFALVLSPMMCSRLMTTKSCTSGLSQKMDVLFEHINHYYKIILDFLIRFRWFVVLFALIVYAGGILFFIFLQSQLAPPEDQGFLMAVVKGPASANLQYTEDHTQTIANIFAASPQVEHSLIINGIPYGVNSALAVAMLKPWSERKVSAMKLQQEWYPKMWSIPGIMAYPVLPPSLPGSTGYTPVEFVLKTMGTYKMLNTVTQKFLTAARQWGGLTNLDSDLNLDKPELNLNIDRNRAANLGIPMSDIASTLSIMLGQPQTTRFSYQGENYQVIPELSPEYRNNPSDLSDLYLRTASNKLVPLSNIASISNTVAPRSLNHFQTMRASMITAGLAPGVTLGDALIHLNKIAAQVLPNTVDHDYAGQMRQYVEASGKMAEVFAFAIIFIYLILAAQFESFIDPLIVMVSVPLSLTGALMLLKLVGATLNIYTDIGLVTLLGLMSKQAILIVEFANQLQERGEKFKDAVLDGSAQRLRPILMTSLAMVLGALPLVFSSGSGAVARFEMGVTVVAGLGIGTILTIFIIPVAYYLFADKKDVEKQTKTPA